MCKHQIIAGNHAFHLQHTKDCAEDYSDYNDPKTKIDIIERQIFIKGNHDSDQHQHLLEIADKCPVHKTLSGLISVKTSLLDA